MDEAKMKLYNSETHGHPGEAFFFTEQMDTIKCRCTNRDIRSTGKHEAGMPYVDDDGK